VLSMIFSADYQVLLCLISFTNIGKYFIWCSEISYKLCEILLNGKT
jgi:hypothetical protein